MPPRPLWSSVLALMAAVSCAAPPADRDVRRGRAWASQGEAQATCRDAALDVVSAIRVTGAEVLIAGFVRDGPLPEHMSPAERRYRLRSAHAWVDASADWQPVRASTRGAIRLRHLASALEAEFGDRPGSSPPVFAAARTGERSYALVIASGDWKIGPRPSFWCEATVTADALGRR